MLKKSDSKNTGAKKRKIDAWNEYFKIFQENRLLHVYTIILVVKSLLFKTILIFYIYGAVFSELWSIEDLFLRSWIINLQYKSRRKFYIHMLRNSLCLDLSSSFFW